MKNFKRTLRKRLICALIALPMIVLAFLPNLITGIDEKQSLGASALNSDPWNGRGSNTISGTGFNDPGSIGATLTEPSTTTTWIEELNFDTYDTSAKFNNLLNETTKANGNFRKNNSGEDLYVSDNPTIGLSAANPWIISNEKEFVFFARMIQLAYNNATNISVAYASRPYFKLEEDIDLAGFRWVPPRFHSPTTNKYVVGTVDYLNRIYFDGNNKTIKNAYVNQIDNGAAMTAAPSIFGNIPMKSIIRNVNIENAFVTVPDSTSALEVSIVSQTTGAECIFEGIEVTNSVLRGYRHMNGIASNASIIKDCVIEKTTFISIPTASSMQIRGIGQASEFNNNSVINTNLEVSNPLYTIYAMGIGQVRAVPVSNLSNGTGYDRDGTTKEWTTETEFDLTPGMAFKGGFYNNTVKNSKIGMTGGTKSSYAIGIGFVNLEVPATFEGNTINNCDISIKTNDDSSSINMHAYGIGYITKAEAGIQISDNAVISSTISVVTRQHTAYASGMFYISTDLGAEIRNCYTENTDVIGRITGSTGDARIYIAGISIGYANLFENCIMGSGNIEARAVGGYVFAYGIGGTFGLSSTAGPTGRKNWTNDAANVGTNNDENGWWDLTVDEKGNYLGDITITKFIGCYNFANITTQSTSVIYAAGIGMGEGFLNCVNYGNVIGNQIGGIAYGFADNTDSTVGTAQGNTVTRTGAIHPLIIENCANFGNMIRAANNQTSYIGGIFSRYETSRNYRKERLTNNGNILVIDNIDGKHLEVTNCISGGRFYFYRPIEVSGETLYEITDDFGSIAHNKHYWGVIFGSVNLRPYTFHESTSEINEIELDKFDEFINERFYFSNNHYSEESAFDFMNLITSNNKHYADDAGNLSEHDHILNSPDSNWRQTLYGATINTFNVRSEYADTQISPVLTEAKAYNVWAAIVLNWKDSMESYEEYDDITSSVWNTDSGVPQLVYSSYPFHILAYEYNRDTVTQGYAPNVSIRKIGDSTPFKIGEFQNIEVGVTIEEWNDKVTESTYQINQEVSISQNIVSGGILAITMLFADDNPTEYSITFDRPNNDYDYDIDPLTASKLKGDEFDVTVSYTTEGDVTGIIWLALVSGEEREIFTDENVEETVIDATNSKYTYKLTITLTEQFILNFADGDNFVIKAEFVEDEIFPVLFEVSNIIDNVVDPTGKVGISVNLTEYYADKTLKVIEGSTVTLTAIYDADLYNFKEFVIIGADNCYTETAGSIDLPSVAITVDAEITKISFELEPRKYDVVIQTYSIASGGMRVLLNNSELIETKNDDLLEKAWIGSQINELEAKQSYEDITNECFYRFIQWEYKSGEFISGEKLTGVINFSSGLFKNNLHDTESGKAFVIVAVFQRQVELIINMENNLGFNNNSYKIFQGNTEIFSEDNRGAIIDENVLVRVEFYPDSRLEIDKIGGISVNERKDYTNNVLYLSLNTLTRLDVNLIARLATISLRNNKAHDGPDLSMPGGLDIITLSNIAFANEISLKINYNEVFTVSVDRTTRANQYRFIALKIKNISTNEFDLVNINFSGNGSFSIEANEEFFQKYVGIDGNCEIWLFIALVYEVNITAPNFTKQSGGYDYKDAYGNSFSLEFIKSASAVVNELDSNNFVIDHGVEIKYTYNEGFGKYYYVNAGESEKENQIITITSTRQIGFLANQYNLTVSKTGVSDASIDSYTKSFGIGSTITIACTVDSAHQINNILINGKPLSDFGAERKGNTITINATPEFIDAVNANLSDNVAVSMEMDTGISNLIMFGGGGGGVALILLVVLTIFLVVRSKRINEKRKAAEALAREYEQRFNIGGMIEDLRNLD